MAEDEKLLKEAKKLPWEERLAHKNWKVRVDANSDICALCEGLNDPKDLRLKDFGPLFKKSIADSNASAQERALDALIAFLRVVDADGARYSKEICDAVVVKCLTGRPKTVEKAQVVLLLWVELETTETFLDAMEKAVKNKVAKAVVLAIDAMYQAVSQFGTKVVPPKKILKMLAELFDHQDQNVRAAAKGLTIELCRWIGKDTVKSILFEKMRDTMKKELEAEVDNVVGGAKPTRKIRSEQVRGGFELEAASEVTAVGAVEDASGIVVEETDEYELVDPVDILGPLSKTVFWEGVKSSKWSERRDAVTELTKLASAKRIAAGDYVEVSRMLKKLITDVNLAVAVEAVQAAGYLARGLRKDYSGGSRGLLPLLLERFKEKKPVMVDALSQTLQTMYGSGCFSLADVVEDVKIATKNKVPSVRSQCLTWVGQCTESSNKATVVKQYKEFVPILMESLSDGTPEVRDAAFGAVAALVKFVGLKPLEKSLEKLDDIKRKRLTDLIAVNGNPAAPASNGVCTALPKAISANGAVPAEDVAVSGNRSAASLLSGNRLPSHGAKKIPSGKQSTVKKGDATLKQSKAVADAQEDVDPGEVSVEDIERQFTTHFESEIVTNLRSSVWKERLEGVLTLQTKVESMPDLDRLVLMLVRFLSVLPGWSEKNVQVQQKMMEIIAKMSETSSSFSKRCVVLCLPGVVERISDVKTRIQATRCLTAFCESVEPEFVVRKLLEAWKDHKNPKVVSEGLLWMVSALDDFGPGHIPVKDVIEFCKDVALQSSAAPTRNAAVKVIGALHRCCGPDIKLYFSDVKPAVQTLVTAECEKNPFTGESILPKRVTRSVNNASKASGGGADALPREDISSKLTPVLMKNFTSVDWKLRQESLETVGTILQEANMRIQPNGMLELLGALKSRLSDSNKNLVIIALSTLGKLGLALGPTFEKNLKLIHMEVLKCLGDNKKFTREAAIKTLDAWLVVVPLGKLLPYVVPAILEMKLGADGRKDLFDWMLKNAGRLDNQADVTLLMKPISSGVQDKSAEVRKAAESLFSEMTKTCGPDMVNKAAKSLQGPSLTAILSLMDRCRVGSDPNSGKESSSDESVKGVGRQNPSSRIAGRGAAGLARGASVRASVTKLPKQEAVAAAMDAAVQGQSLFNLKDCSKEEREKSILRRPKFEEPRSDQVQDVEVDLLKYFREDVHRRMLSPDFRKQVEGVDILQRAIPEHFKEMIEVLDILLRWIVLRVCESNTICLLKVLDFLQDLFTALGDDGYLMTEWEAANLFPGLVEKSGHNIEKVREKMRDLMRLLCTLYQPSKIFVYLTEGLRSKNNRSRIECVDHIGFLIERYGIEVGGPGRCLQGVVAVTTERDGDLRKASLQTLATAYQILGDDVWKCLGKLSDMQRSLLDEKFKWKAREMDKRKDGRAGDFRGMRRLPDDNAVDSAEHSGDSSGSRNGTMSHNSGPFQPNPAASSMIQPVGPVDWREAIVVIEAATNSEKAVDGMKVICYELGQAVGDVEGGLLDELAESVDELVRSLTTRVSKSFKAWLSGASLRACKYVLNTVMQTFQVKRLAIEVKENTLHALITELLLWLLDDRVPQLDDGSHILKALNVLMLKILENANRTSAFVVLIDLLHPSFGISRSDIPNLQESFLSSQRFSELVVKCLIKLTKVLGSTINEVDLDRLLQSIHECFQQLGLEEIRKRAGADDKPLRMVKTVLHELVKLRGTAIKGHLSMVPIDSEPQPIILAYIDLNLQTLAASRVLAPTVTGSQVHWLDSGANGPDSTPSSSAETQLKQELAAIFKKIGDKQTSTIGLYELYRITQLYPQVDIFSQLQNASMAFRTYIRDGLAQMEKSAATGRTPITSSFVSPPPLSTSPGQLQTKATLASSDVNGISNSFSSACTDDTEISNGVLSSSEFDVALQRRVSPQTSVASTMQSISQRSPDSIAVPVPEVQGGTLNAIRERMKNIQAAAAGNTGTFGLHSLASSEAVVAPRTSISSDLGSQQKGEPISDKALSGLQARMERLKSGVIDPAY